MKILVFSPFYPPHIGGLESHSDEFNQHLSSLGAHISVFTPHLPKEALETETHPNGVRIVRFPAFEPMHNYPLPIFWSSHFWKHWRSLFQNDYDMVISRTRFFFPSLMALWYARKRNLPLVHIEHGSDFAKFNGYGKTKLGELYDWIFGRFILRSADRLIGNSQASCDFVKKLSGRSDCQPIYRGANLEAIENTQPRHDLREKYHDKVIIAFIGRLIDGKGTHDLITALAELKRDNIVCFIIGSGPEETRLKKMTEGLQIENKIIFFGNLPFHEAISILKTADIAVNPSYTEGLPTSVTEAALCQKAIIATHVGGTKEIISGKNDGYLINPKDIEQLKEKIIDLIDHPEKRLTFGKNAYQEACGKFSWNESAQKYLAVFTELLENRKI